MSILIAMALAGASVPAKTTILDVVTDVCEYADKDVNYGGEWKHEYERYIGRMEIRMMEARMTERDKENTRAICEIWFRGSVYMADKFIKMLEKKE